MNASAQRNKVAIPSAEPGSNQLLYSEPIIRRGLQKFEHLEALTSDAQRATTEDSLYNHPEDLWCFFLDLRLALRLLPLRQRKALFVHLVMAVPEEEAAQRLHISRAALRERVLAGLANMRKLLNSYQHPLRSRGTMASLAGHDVAGRS